MSINRVNFTLDQYTLDVMNTFCSSHYISKSQFIRLAVNEYIKNRKISNEPISVVRYEKEKTILQALSEKKNGYCEAPLCKSFEGVLTEGISYSNEGEVKRKMYLCKFHIAKAKREGMEIKEL